jgi:hypothetical protein
MYKIMRFFLFFIATLFLSVSQAQNVGINGSGTAPAASAMLDVAAANKGLLIPRVGLSAINNNAPIGAGIVTSMLVYNTATAGVAPNNVTPGFYYWNGTIWVRSVDYVIERWFYPAASYAPGTTQITATIPGVTSTTSAMINLIGDWAVQPNVTIHHVESRTGAVRFRLTNNTTLTTYNSMDFVITIIR